MKHFVYIIYSQTYDIYYKGYSIRPFDRLNEHNNNESRYTSGKGPWELVFVQEFATKKEALQREKALKRANRDYIKWLIKQPSNLLVKKTIGEKPTNNFR
ncbi:MAG: GIY-YIG nuclease family protein [Chlorobi bacterium]|nr:GIY-YIG nuclease family protein [Chlorobiota bacterium]